LLCWSSVIVRDVMNPIRKQPMSDRAQIIWTRWIIVGIGAFLVFWGIWQEIPDSVWNYMAVTGTIYLSGAGVVIVGGMYWRRASCVGAWGALLGGLVAVSGLFVGDLKQHIPWIDTAIALGTYGFCAVLFVTLSLLFPDRTDSRTAEIV